MTPQLDWLAAHPQHSDTFAAWIHRQFHYEYADQPLTDWQQEFAEGQLNGHWKCLIALEGNQLKGGAALARADLAHRPDLGPWLACVFITPEARGKGLAERLIEGICEEARASGVTRIICTPRINATTTPSVAGRRWNLFGRGTKNNGSWCENCEPLMFRLTPRVRWRPWRLPWPLPATVGSSSPESRSDLHRSG